MNKDIYFRYDWRYKKEDFKFCPRCENSFVLEDIHIENQPQLICHTCHFIFYLDPKLVVSAIVFNQCKSKILLLKRAESPQKDLWAFPGGHVERGEDVFEAIQKEIFEESGIETVIEKIVHTESNSSEGIVEIIFEAIALSEEVKLNMESVEGHFFSLNHIPFEELAFPTIKKVIEKFKDNDQ